MHKTELLRQKDDIPGDMLPSASVKEAVAQITSILSQCGQIDNTQLVWNILPDVFQAFLGPIIITEPKTTSSALYAVNCLVLAKVLFINPRIA